jgi:NHL repeat
MYIRNYSILLASLLLAGSHAIAQTEINFDSVPNALKLPANIYLGEVGGVATDSKGNVYVYTRTGHPFITIGTARPFAHGGSRLFEFDRTGRFVREIGKDSYAFMVASQLRVDPQDNIWAVDEMTNTIMKFDQTGHIAMLLGRKAENVNVPADGGRGAGGGGGRGAGGAGGRGAGGGGGRGRGAGVPGAGQPTDLFDRPADVAWDAQGNIFVADGEGANARVAKYSKDGVFVKSWGKKGTANGDFADVHGMAVDAQGNVYAADSGNNRVQIFDNDGNYKSSITNVGSPKAVCMTKGPNQVLYVSNSNPVNDIDKDGEIYKVGLDGTVMGKFGRAGKLPKEFGTVNAIDCREANTLWVGEIGNPRVQKLTLH